MARVGLLAGDWEVILLLSPLPGLVGTGRGVFSGWGDSHLDLNVKKAVMIRSFDRKWALQSSI